MTSTKSINDFRFVKPFFLIVTMLVIAACATDVPADRQTKSTPAEIHAANATSVGMSNGVGGPLDSLVWGQQGKLLASDALPGDQFGVTVSVSGDTAIVGAWYADVNGNNGQGAAYIFVRNGSMWTEQAKLLASDGGSSDHFGVSVAISGDTAVVGAYDDPSGGNTGQGSAYVFMRNGLTWVEQAKLLASDGSFNDNFGFSVALDGDTALIGAYDNDVGSNGGPGQAYVFVRNGSTWTEQAKLLASDGGPIDLFGWSVSVSGDTALIGARGHDVGSNVNEGQAYIFVRNGSTWAEQAKLNASDGADYSSFGWSVSVWGDTAVVGAVGNVGAVYAQGSAYIFVRNGTTWAEEAKLVASDGAASDQFGSSVVVSGDTAIMGAPYVDIGSDKNQGAAYLFQRNGSTWTEEKKLVASDGFLGDSLGSSVALSGDTAIVGASRATLNDEGAAYVFAFRAPNGDTCTVGGDCVTGFCVDGVCCDSECGQGDPNDCQSCAVAAGALVDGECAPLPKGKECRASVSACDMAETCDGTRVCPDDTNAPDGTTCPGGLCSAGVCMSTGEGGAGGATSSSSSSSGGGNPIDPESGGCACQTSSQQSPISGCLALLGFAALVFRGRARRYATTATACALSCSFVANAHAQEQAARPIETTGEVLDPNTIPLARTNVTPLRSASLLPQESMWGAAVDPPSKKATRWYGWQTLIPLVTADVFFAVTWLEGSNIDAIRASLVLGPMVHLFSGPIVHWAHGHFDKGAAAFGMNLGIPGSAILLVTMGLEANVFNHIPSSVGFPLVIGFAGGGFLAAQTLDIAFLSSETSRIPLESSKSAKTWLPSSVTLVPMIDSTQQGIMLGGGGTLIRMAMLAGAIGNSSGRLLRVAESDTPVRAPVFFDEPTRRRSQAFSSKDIDDSTLAHLLAHWAHESKLGNAADRSQLRGWQRYRYRHGSHIHPIASRRVRAQPSTAPDVPLCAQSPLKHLGQLNNT